MVDASPLDQTPGSGCSVMMSTRPMSCYGFTGFEGYCNDHQSAILAQLKAKVDLRTVPTPPQQRVHRQVSKISDPDASPGPSGLDNNTVGSAHCSTAISPFIMQGTPG